MNYNHIMPTRYTLDVDLKFVSPDVLEDATKKVETKKVSSLTWVVFVCRWRWAEGELIDVSHRTWGVQCCMQVMGCKASPSSTR